MVNFGSNSGLSNSGNAPIQIGQFNLRVPGQNAETGERVANGVSQSLARQVPRGLQRQLGAMNVRVEVPAGASEGEMSEAIASAIVNALQRRT